jgi:SAM-dependent methyltransferase
MQHLVSSINCPLCLSANCQIYSEDRRRQYWHCAQCELIFADPTALLNAEAELNIYQQHQNDPQDQRYRAFLNKLAAPLLQRLPSSMKGLDFGCGPGPTLSLMLAEAGHQMAIYDPYFANEPKVLTGQYDFICATEVIEHFYRPAQEWQLWLQLLKPGGWLGLMTKLTDEVDDFKSWHYKNDPTHVSFFSTTTFEYLATRDGFELEILGPDVILLHKV